MSAEHWQVSGNVDTRVAAERGNDEMSKRDAQTREVGSDQDGTREKCEWKNTDNDH
jgi:hypothetical protein